MSERDGDPAAAGGALAATGLDALAVKPTECSVERAADAPVEGLTVDYEGRDHLPEATALRAATASGQWVRVTTPVRADGFDPHGDDGLVGWLPDAVGRVLVAGNPAYLDDAERGRAVAPRLRAARDAAPDAWVGTEGIERVALVVGGTQFDLLSRSTRRDCRALRAAGLEADVAVYAPTVLSPDDDAVLDALGDYLARRRRVRRALPGDPEALATDADATGRTREVLRAAADDYALTGTPAAVGERVRELKAAGATTLVGYPARGVDRLLDAG